MRRVFAEFDNFASGSSAQLLRFARALCGDWALAEDLVQDALLAVWQRWDRLDPSALDSYARRVVYTRFVDRYRRVGGWREVELNGVAEPAIADPAELTTRQIALQAALAELPARQRAAVVLRCYLDLSERETANILGCSVGTVKSQTSRGLASIRRRTVAPAGPENHPSEGAAP